MNLQVNMALNKGFVGIPGACYFYFHSLCCSKEGIETLHDVCAWNAMSRVSVTSFSNFSLTIAPIFVL